LVHGGQRDTTPDERSSRHDHNLAASFGSAGPDRRAAARRKDKSVGARVGSGLTLLLLPLALACTPTVRVQAPTEPITINLNVRLDADVRVRLEERAPQTVQANPGIF
jgi:hypothetical protein